MSSLRLILMQQMFLLLLFYFAISMLPYFLLKNAYEYLNNSHFAQVLEICTRILTNKSTKIHKDISFMNLILSWGLIICSSTSARLNLESRTWASLPRNKQLSLRFTHNGATLTAQEFYSNISSFNSFYEILRRESEKW